MCNQSYGHLVLRRLTLWQVCPRHLHAAHPQSVGKPSGARPAAGARGESSRSLMDLIFTFIYIYGFVRPRAMLLSSLLTCLFRFCGKSLSVFELADPRRCHWSHSRPSATISKKFVVHLLSSAKPESNGSRLFTGPGLRLIHSRS
jgi:hypothetical protein